MIFDLLRRLFKSRAPEASQEPEDDLDPFNPFPEPVVIEFRDEIDLHSIPPRQAKAVVEDYLEEAHRRGVSRVRIIHGKGIGVQREMVRTVLARTPFVVEFRDAPPEAGGWGATLVWIKKPEFRSQKSEDGRE